MFRSMKIEINEDQPINDVVKELERLGYECVQFFFHVSKLRGKEEYKYISCYTDGRFLLHKYGFIYFCEDTTLAELKEMK